MSAEFSIGRRVVLVTFHGEPSSPTPVEVDDNYWNLIGEEGVIESEILKEHSAYPEKGKRALVKFDKDLSSLGLVNHNQTPNSLWIFISDLKGI
ncbi:hypothetical protein ACFL19_00065 [Pseudomonadota bacterium]